MSLKTFQSCWHDPLWSMVYELCLTIHSSFCIIPLSRRVIEFEYSNESGVGNVEGGVI